MDGTGNSGITGTYPIDQERVDAVEKWHKISKYFKNEKRIISANKQIREQKLAQLLGS